VALSVFSFRDCPIGYFLCCDDAAALGAAHADGLVNAVPTGQAREASSSRKRDDEGSGVGSDGGPARAAETPVGADLPTPSSDVDLSRDTPVGVGMH